MINFPECHLHASQAVSLAAYYAIPPNNLERITKSTLAHSIADEIANKFTAIHQSSDDENMTILYTLDIYCFTDETLAQFIQAIREDFLRSSLLREEVNK